MRKLILLILLVGCAQTADDQIPLDNGHGEEGEVSEEASEASCDINMSFDQKAKRCIFARGAVISVFYQSAHYSASKVGTPEKISLSLEVSNAYSCQLSSTSDGTTRIIDVMTEDSILRGQITLYEMVVEVNSDTRFSLNCKGDYGTVSEDRYYYYRESILSKISHLENIKQSTNNVQGRFGLDLGSNDRITECLAGKTESEVIYQPQSIPFSRAIVEIEKSTNLITISFRSRSNYIKKQKLSKYTLGESFKVAPEICLAYPVTLANTYADNFYYSKRNIVFSSGKNLDEIRNYIELQLRINLIDFTRAMTNDGVKDINKIIDSSEIKFDNKYISRNHWQYNFSKEIIDLGLFKLALVGSVPSVTNVEQEEIARRISNIVLKSKDQLSEEDAQQLGEKKFVKSKNYYKIIGRAINFSFADMKHLLEGIPYRETSSGSTN